MPRQATTEQIYSFIRDFIHRHGYSPSQREIARGCYLSVGTVFQHLILLEARGKIHREEGRARSITLLEERPGQGGVSPN